MHAQNTRTHTHTHAHTHTEGSQTLEWDLEGETDEYQERSNEPECVTFLKENGNGLTAFNAAVFVKSWGCDVPQ